MAFELFSPDFSQTIHIPATYTCQGRNINPTFRFFDVPPNTQSLALIFDDPDDKTDPEGSGEVFDNWVVYNIPPNVRVIGEGTLPEGAEQGKNSRGENAYFGPCPKSQPHLYRVRLFALDTAFKPDVSTTKAALEAAMEGHIIATTALSGIYQPTTLTSPPAEPQPQQPPPAPTLPRSAA